MTDRRSHSIALALVAACVVTATSGCSPRQMSSVAPAAEIPVFAVEKFTLPNGLRVVMSVDRSAPVVALATYYHVGSKNETAGRTGFAHLFEHLMFEGSAHVPPRDHHRILGEGGGGAGGFTKVDYTWYPNVFPSNYLETAMWLESDRMGFLVPALNAEKLSLQREIVNNERRQNYLNPPFGVQPIIAMPAVYPAGHPYSWRTIGYEDDLATVKLDDVKEFFTRYYVPNNAVISIVGDIDLAQTRALVEKYFGDIPRGADIVRPAAPPVTLPAEKRVVLEDAKGRVPQITFIWPTVGVRDADEASLVALGTLLGAAPNSLIGARSARLSKTLVYDRALATSVEAFQMSDEDAGIFLIEVVPRAGASLTEIETIIDSVLASIATSPATDSEISRLRNSLIVEKITGLQSVQAKSDALALAELYFKDPLHYVRDAQEIMAVTPSDMQRVAARFLTPGRVVISMVPAGKLDLISRPDRPYTNVTPAAPAPVSK